jgi:hypothetical protein
MFERRKGEESSTDQGLWPLPLVIQMLIAEVSLCLLTGLLYHNIGCRNGWGGPVSHNPLITMKQIKNNRFL